jgi:hypothetical protein
VYVIPIRTRILAVMMLVSASAHADSPKGECVEAYEQGQILRRKGELVRASEQVVSCARDVCPAFMRVDCAQWHAELEGAIPTIVVIARTRDGADIADVRVSVDGRVISERLEGRAIALDPGAHTLRLERKGMPALERPLVVSEGQKLREVIVEFGDVRPSPEPSRQAPASLPLAESPSRGGTPAPAWIVGGVGVLALSTFVTLGISGRSEQSNHLEKCNPRCAPDEVDSVRTKYIAADIALGVAVVSFAVSAFLFLTHNRPSPPTRPGRP